MNGSAVKIQKSRESSGDDWMRCCKSNDLIRCCICGQKIIGKGNNPFPVKIIGRTCDVCDVLIVLPKRVEAFYKVKEMEGIYGKSMR